MLKVTAAIIKKNNEILICQRGKDDDGALLWEFPGGKLEEGESLEQCIIREMKEELELDIKVKDLFAETEYRYGEKGIHFTFYEAEILGGIMKLNVHEKVIWASVNSLLDYDFLPADLPIIDLLQKKYHEGGKSV